MKIIKKADKIRKRVMETSGFFQKNKLKNK